MDRGRCQDLHGGPCVAYVAAVTVIEVTSADPVLAILAPIALAAARGTALVVDRWPGAGWPFPTGSLSELAESGPTADQLRPGRPGIAVLGGSAERSAVDELISTLSSGWPALVVRSAPTDPNAVTVGPALPWGPRADVTVGTAWDRGSVPRPSGRLVRRLLAGQVDVRWRWFRHWSPLWEMSA